MHRIRSWARTKAHGPSPLSKDSSRPSILPLNHTQDPSTSTSKTVSQNELDTLPSTAKIVRDSSLLSHATESVAKRMGDTIGALMNVTFGNAVELIIFIALAKGEIRIVQASLLGSILANLLLILGMSFLLGGLRFQEQHCYSDECVSAQFECHELASSGSNTTAKRIKRAFTGRRRRKSSAGSDEKAAAAAVARTRTSSIGTSSISPVTTDAVEEPQTPGHRFGAIDFSEDADDENRQRSRRGSHGSMVFPSMKERKALRREKERRRQERKELKRARKTKETITEGVELGQSSGKTEEGPAAPRRVDFAVVNEAESQPEAVKPVRIFPSISLRPAIPKTFSQNVFTMPAPTPAAPVGGPIPRVKMGIRRTNSLPDRLNQTYSGPARASSIGTTTPHVNSTTIMDNNDTDEEENISRTTAVVLLLVSTGLVAVCAEFMVDSINAVVEGNSGLSETFIGLIILPIVGNAAEHVTAVTVATKNKMDLAIGVAVGSSIQIALFVTPFVVLLGWAMGKEMSLYFTLFETVSLFVSAFIVNFLVLDGRSNYLEGALLCAAYVIIAVAAFFYPQVEDQSNLGGNEAAAKMIRGLVGI
ncbi:putative Vacuolar calcium ion transporter [Glarea lozoyensis 74030]|uniref:Putative Vacuolar calcium ion transporter n=1 Tax=Glarea lozoyensis (strain ATCC 74030 / MF5533) TaxID=1104152 RepID=H0EUC3_GLAL7|nr:putative Vacuolar calcium ion transporter [Glarea lozoyensis 74030]